jgi:hypothetical protein
MGYLIVLCVGMLAGMLSGAIWHSLINDVAARHRQSIIAIRRDREEFRHGAVVVARDRLESLTVAPDILLGVRTLLAPHSVEVALSVLGRRRRIDRTDHRAPFS